MRALTIVILSLTLTAGAIGAFARTRDFPTPPVPSTEATKAPCKCPPKKGHRGHPRPAPAQPLPPVPPEVQPPAPQ